jgi:hypothetical protein
MRLEVFEALKEHEFKRGKIIKSYDVDDEMIRILSIADNLVINEQTFRIFSTSVDIDNKIVTLYVYCDVQ